MVVALLMALAVATVSGVLMRTTLLWGDETIERIHGGSANLAVLLIGGHLIGVLIASLQHKEVLPVSMITGIKTDTASAQAFLGDTPPRPKRMFGSLATGLLVAGVIWGAQGILNASVWRLPRMITAAAQEKQCGDIQLSGATLQVYPKVQIVYDVNGATRIEVPLDKFMAKKPKLDFSKLDTACATAKPVTPAKGRVATSN
jgi:hypothetical protein